MSLEPGSEVAGRYRVDHQIAEGGMGIVYRVTREGTPFAMKVIRGGLTKGEATVERFKREAQLLAQIDHPGVVKMVDAGVLEDGAVFLVMELLEGETLFDRFVREAPLTPRTFAPILRGVADALDAVHAIGAVHRDLKPSNVFLTSSGVKLVDFGIAHAADGTRLTVTGQIIGTLRYMAPEQVLDKAVDARTDVYALGVMTWGALAGGPPFGGKGMLVLEQVMKGAPSLGLAAANAGPEIIGVVDRAVAKDMAARFDSAGAFATAFKEALSTVPRDTFFGNPTGYQPIDTTDRIAGRANEPVESGTLEPAGSMRPPTVSAHPKSTRSRYGRAGLALAAAGLLVLTATGGWLYMRRSQPAPRPDPAAIQEVPVPEADPEPAPPPEPEVRRVLLESDPAGAEVFRGEVLLGATPLELAVEAEPFTLDVRQTGYLPLQVRLGPQTSDHVMVSLEPVEAEGESEIVSPWDDESTSHRRRRRRRRRQHRPVHQSDLRSPW